MQRSATPTAMIVEVAMPNVLPVPLLLGHERIGVLRRRRERLLDRSRAHPANEVELRPGLVVRSAGSRTAEGLLAHHRARRLVVDVEVSCRVAERDAGLLDGAAVR